MASNILLLANNEDAWARIELTIELGSCMVASSCGSDSDSRGARGIMNCLLVKVELVVTGFLSSDSGTNALVVYIDIHSSESDRIDFFVIFEPNGCAVR